MKTVPVILLLIILVPFSPVSVSAQVDSVGSDFTLAFLRNDFNADFGAQVIELHLATEVTTTVEVFYPSKAAVPIAVVSVAPNSVTTVPIDLDAAVGWVENSVADNTVRLRGSAEFSAYAVNRDFFTSDVARALPHDALGTEYIVADYPSIQLGSMFVVYAIENATTVTITPSTALVGQSAGVPFTVNLDAGEGYYGITLTAGVSATGTIVSADKPVGLVNGSYCAQIPVEVLFCDHVFEYAEPVGTWGRTFVLANLPQRPGGTIYRVIAAEDATTVMIDGTPPTTLQRGQFLETPPLAGDHVVTADGPVAVVQYMTGDESPGATDGDPAMGNVIPMNRFLDRYTVCTPMTFEFTTHYVTLTVANADVGALLLDGVPVPSDEFAAVGTSGYSVARILVDQGVHTTASSAPHGVTVAGYGFNNSYLYSGGAMLQVSTLADPFPPLCDIVIDEATSMATGTASDAGPGEDLNGNGTLDIGEDLNDNGVLDVQAGIVTVALDTTSTNLFLDVAPFAPGSNGVPFTVTLVDASLPGTGVVLATDGVGNVSACPVTLSPANPTTTLLGEPAVSLRRFFRVFAWPFSPNVTAIAEFTIDIVSEPETGNDFARITVVDASQNLPQCGPPPRINAVYFNFPTNVTDAQVTVLAPSSPRTTRRNRFAGEYGRFDYMVQRDPATGDFVFEVRRPNADVTLNDFELNENGFRLAARVTQICTIGVGIFFLQGPNGRAFSGTP